MQPSESTGPPDTTQPANLHFGRLAKIRGAVYDSTLRPVAVKPRPPAAWWVVMARYMDEGFIQSRVALSGPGLPGASDLSISIADRAAVFGARCWRLSWANDQLRELSWRHRFLNASHPRRHLLHPQKYVMQAVDDTTVPLVGWGNRQNCGASQAFSGSFCVIYVL